MKNEEGVVETISRFEDPESAWADLFFEENTGAQ